MRMRGRKGRRKGRRRRRHRGALCLTALACAMKEMTSMRGVTVAVVVVADAPLFHLLSFFLAASALLLCCCCSSPQGFFSYQ